MSESHGAGVHTPSSEAVRGAARIGLVEGWGLSLRGDPASVPQHVRGAIAAGVDARAPSAVHLDLLRAGLIEDPYVGRAELECGWVSRVPWTMRKQVRLGSPPAENERLDLVLEGVDTFADVLVNGESVGRCENMHVTHRFDLRGLAREGDNEIRVDFDAPHDRLEQLRVAHGEPPHEGHGTNPRHPHNLVRKMACSWGWDWGPVLPGCGLWRPARLERWRAARIDAIRPLVVSADPSEARLDVHVDLERAIEEGPEPVSLIIRLFDPLGHEVASAEPVSLDGSPPPAVLSVPSPALWWPVGMGGQPLYTLSVVARDGRGAELDARTCKIGLRTVSLETGVLGEDFHLRINGERVFCRGANWIPDDCFPARVTREQYRERVGQARDANMNMLRVWGGGVYESEAFYEACDEAGVMVWQDFLFSCAAYHEHEPYRGWVETEARQNVARLSPHPSLVLWCGNNECHEAVAHWGVGFENVRNEPGTPWGAGFYHGLLPGIVDELDPSRPYWPGSPYSGTPDRDPRDELAGDVHIWDVWNNELDGLAYMTHAPRFASEFGFHGPPSWATLARAVPEEERSVDSPTMVHHNKHAGGQTLAKKLVADWFEEPAGFGDWHYLAQVLQARSLAFGCSWFRALSPDCSGTLYWQLNDCWPVASWAAIDGDGRPKPLWYATRRFFDPRLVTIAPLSHIEHGDNPLRPRTLGAHLVNDTPERWEGEMTVTRHGLRTGRSEKEILRRSFGVAPGESTRCDISDAVLGSGPDSFLVASVDERRAYWFFARDRDLAYTPAMLNVSVDHAADAGSGAWDVTVEASSLVRDLCLFADRLAPEGRVNDQLITMLPGDRVTLRVTGVERLSAGDLTEPALQSINRFGGGFSSGTLAGGTENPGG